MRKNHKKQNKFDYLILFIFIISIIVPIIVATSQQYIVQYGDDIVMLTWAKDHTFLESFTSKEGTGYRPVMNMMYSIGYTLWGNEAKYYYLFSGLFFAGGMVFLYLLGKTLHSRLAGFVAVILFLLLDASFILVSKLNYIVSTGEIFFITSAVYFSITYFKTKNQTSMWLAIILSVLGFFTKEPSIVIIPSIVLVYLYLNNLLNKKYIILCSIPFLYLIAEMLFISPEINASSGIITRIINNFNFYLDTEINYQFKTPILLIVSFLIASYLYSYNGGSVKKEILLCMTWIIMGAIPILITSQPVQPTYLPELNLGVVILIGIVIAEVSKKYDKSKPIIPIILFAAILFQIMFISGQISGMQNYNKMISDNQNTFLETVDELKQLPQNEKIFYFSEETRIKYGGYQINEIFFKKYLCLRDICNLGITSNYSDANYIILPSSLDVQIFQKEYPNEKISVIKQIKHDNDYGFILKKV